MCIFFDRLAVCLSVNVQQEASAPWSLNIILVSVRGDKTPMLTSVLTSDNISVCVCVK